MGLVYLIPDQKDEEERPGEEGRASAGRSRWLRRREAAARSRRTDSWGDTVRGCPLTGTDTALQMTTTPVKTRMGRIQFAQIRMCDLAQLVGLRFGD